MNRPKAFVHWEHGDVELDSDWTTKRFRVWIQMVDDDPWSRIPDQFLHATIASAERRIASLQEQFPELGHRENIV